LNEDKTDSNWEVNDPLYYQLKRIFSQCCAVYSLSLFHRITSNGEAK